MIMLIIKTVFLIAEIALAINAVKGLRIYINNIKR